MNRRQDAMQDMFLLSLLLCAMGLFVPDAVVLFPVAWWALFMMRSSNLRTYLASLLAILTVALYGAILWFKWPDSIIVRLVLDQWSGVFDRVNALQLQLVLLVVSAVLALLGLWSIVAHMRRYSRANVRIQTRVLLVLPVYVLSLLSVIFPIRSGNCLLSELWLSSGYLTILYLATYGFPRIRWNRSSANTSRRLSRRADSQNPFKRRKKDSVYGNASRRSFSRRSRRR